MAQIQGLREQILANTKYLPLPVPNYPVATKQKTSRSAYSSSYELVVTRNTAPTGDSIASAPGPSTTTTTSTFAASYKALLLTSPHEGAHIRIEGPAAETVEAALQGMLEVTAGLVEEEMKRRVEDVIKVDEILDSREDLGPGVLVVMRLPDEEMEVEGGDGAGGVVDKGEDGDGGGGAVGKVEGKRGAGRPKKAEDGGATAASAAAGAGGAAVDGEGRVVKRGRGRPRKNAG
ncbi:hypothetical protein NU219Hw_g4304t1 [Hortaea werneckii]